MDIVFVDDAHQSSPFRKGIGSLVAAGAINIPTANLSSAERKLEAICKAAGFPDGQEFKWSPGKELWMKAGLTGQARAEFFSSILLLLAAENAKACIVIEDKSYRTADGAKSHEIDVTRLLLERIDNDLKRRGKEALLIADRPGGGRDDENRFIAESISLLRSGTSFVRFSTMPLDCASVLSL